MTKSTSDSDKDKKQFQEHRKQLKILYADVNEQDCHRVWHIGRLRLFAYHFSVCRYLLEILQAELIHTGGHLQRDLVGFAVAMTFFFFDVSRHRCLGNTFPALHFYAMGVVYTRSNRLNASMAESQYQPYNYPYVPEKA